MEEINPIKDISSFMQKDDKIAHIYIYGVIDSWQNEQAKKDGYVNLKDVKKQYDAQKDADRIVVHLHSPGGVVVEGFAMHDYLRSLGKPIKTIIEGYCASIATIVALAGDERLMTSNATFMIHNPWGVVIGESKDLKKEAKEMADVEDRIAKFYALKTKIAKEEALALMKEESVFTPKEALNKGFITEIEKVMKAVALLRPPQNLTDKELVQEFNKRIKKDKKMEFFKQIKNLMGFKASLELTLATGDIINISTDAQEPSIGDEVTDKDGGLMPDGKHLMADGSSIVTADSQVKEILSADNEQSDKIENRIKGQESLIKEQGEAIVFMAKSLKNMQLELTAIRRNIKSEDYQVPKAENTSRLMKIDETDSVLEGTKKLNKLKKEKNG